MEEPDRPDDHPRTKTRRQPKDQLPDFKNRDGGSRFSGSLRPGVYKIGNGPKILAYPEAAWINPPVQTGDHNNNYRPSYVAFASMEGKEVFEHVEHMEHAAHRGSFSQRAAVVVAVLAALLAISTLIAERAAEHVVLAQAQANDVYNEYQANSLKVHVNEATAATLRALGAQTPQSGAAEAQAAKLEAADTDKYNPNKVTLLAKAKDFETERDTAEHHHKVLQLAQGAFQLGIVLTSAALLSQMLLLMLAGGGLGLLGLILVALSWTPITDRLFG